jgi:CelD/BcsL family acetyltransferase involved in cellulose biosynthesis
VSLVESIERFDDLAREWNALAERSNTAHLFNAHDWMAAWWRAFAKPDDRLRVYGVREDGRLLAILPLMLRGRTLRSLFNHYLGRSDALLDPIRERHLLELLFAAIYDDRGLWDTLELMQVPEDSPTIAALASGAADPLHVHAVRNITSPYLPTRGRTYDEWYASRFSGRRRQQDRRKWRQAEKLGDAQIVVHVDPEAALAAFERGVEVEAKSWKSEEQSAMKQDDRVLAFMRDVVGRFARGGGVRLIEMTVDGAQAAFLLGFVHRRTFYFHKTGYDPALKDASPGRHVLLRSIRLAFEEGLARYDFLGAADSYKLDCSPLVRPHVIAFAYHRGLASRVARERKRLVPLVRRLRGEPVEFEVRLDR